MVSETKLKRDSLSINIEIKGYIFVHADSTTNAGRVGIYIECKFYPCICDDVSQIHGSEYIFIRLQLKTSDYVFGLVYRHSAYSSENFQKFENFFNDVIEHLNSSALSYCIAGDCSIDLLKYMIDTKIKAYADILLSNSCKLLFDKPTRTTSSSATLIDHIIRNNISSETISGIGLCGITDHLAVFAIIPASYKFNKRNKRISRDIKNFNQDHFLNDLCQQFNENLTPEDNDPNAYFSNFRNLLSQKMDKNATKRPITRREQFSRNNPGSLMDF